MCIKCRFSLKEKGNYIFHQQFKLVGGYPVSGHNLFCMDNGAYKQLSGIRYHVMGAQKSFVLHQIESIMVFIPSCIFSSQNFFNLNFRVCFANKYSLKQFERLGRNSGINPR